jgi:hypothetical protein
MTPTDIAAWFGAVTGLCALVWQAWSRTRSSHKVVVRRAASYIVGHRVGEPVVEVSAHNVGAGPVTVTSWGIDMADKSSFVMVRPHFASTALPYRLEPGAGASFFMPRSELLRAMEEHRCDARQLRAWVRLGTGQQIFAKPGIPAMG